MYRAHMLYNALPEGREYEASDDANKSELERKWDAIYRDATSLEYRANMLLPWDDLHERLTYWQESENAMKQARVDIKRLREEFDLNGA